LLSKDTKEHKTISLPLAVHECETWSLTYREEHWLRVFNNRVPKKIFGPNVTEVTEDQRILQNEELQNFYPHQIINRLIEPRGIRWVRNVAFIGKKCIKDFC
jgi:hypothetical protein